MRKPSPTPSADPRLELRYYYNHNLSEEDRRFYRFLVDCISARKFHFYYVKDRDSASVPEEHRHLPFLEYKDAEIPANPHEIFYYILWDFPEFFFLLDNGMHFDQETGKGDVEPLFDIHRYSEAEIRSYTRKLDKLYHSFDGVETGFAYELAVTEYIIRHYEYAHYAKRFSRGKKYIEAFTVVGLLKRGEAVCAGISRLALYLFQRRGMEAAILTAEPSGAEPGHCWLAVKLNGKYYHLDITFGEDLSKDLYIPQKQYFNITDRERIESLPYYMPVMYPEIVCNSRRDNYYYHLGLYLRTPAEITSAVERFIEENRHAEGTVYFYFRTPRRLAQKAATAGIRKALDPAVVRTCASLHYDGYYAVEMTFRHTEPRA